MLYNINIVLTFHTRFKEKSSFNCDALSFWMAENYDYLHNYGNAKMSITINKSSFGIHRQTEYLHGHIALEAELKTYKKNHTDYTNLKAFKNMIKRNLKLTENPFDVPLSLSTPHMTMKFKNITDKTDLHEFHLAYVMKEYESFEELEMLDLFVGLNYQEIEQLRLFANQKYKDTIKKKEYDEKYNNRQNQEFEELLKYIDLTKLPNEKYPVSLFDEVLYQLTDHLCSQDIPLHKKVQKEAKLASLAYIYSQNLIKNKKNRQKLIRHKNRYHIPREETRQDEFKVYANYITNLDPNDISPEQLKKLQKLTSN